MEQFKGTGVALVTPMKTDGSIDEKGLGNLLTFTATGVDYWVVLGTTGESATLNNTEKAKILAFTKAHNPKKLPIVYGLGGNNTGLVISQIGETDWEGVDAMLSASPYYNKPSQAGIIAHYEKIADTAPVPVILYNVPGRTASNLTAETTLRLAEHPNILGIKEASGDIKQCAAIAAHKPEDFLLISGEDLLTPDLLALGGHGVISVLANGFPVAFSDVVNLGLRQKNEACQQAMKVFHEIDPFLYQESNPVGIKEVLRQKKVCEHFVRLPLLPATTGLQDEITRCLKEIESKVERA